MGFPGLVRGISIYCIRDALRTDALAASADSAPRGNLRTSSDAMTSRKNIVRGLAALLVAGVIWLPCLHFFFAKSASQFHQQKGISPQARELAARHVGLWTEPKLRERELRRMRASNA